MSKYYSSPAEAITQANQVMKLLAEHQNLFSKPEGNYAHFLQDDTGSAGKNLAKNLTEFHSELVKYFQSLEY
ncbi:hypothetical protein [Chromobacterium haemolyticum]|uniref:hypothetical protein n=1 Tax=Chromobacterium haemolyticum TaxID=394935 RepID=UPI0017460B60|nr:hypothetical protein [Chromobacterium haemolyticum]QOD84170.1 hypothetical protein IEZ30_06765 [Chromobacterium haemolyticum]